ncbi:MAG: GreA/GreB family elongation factor, partial [Nitrospinaceae bacterium]
MFLQSRISQLQHRISNIMGLDIQRISRDKAGLGSCLHLKNLETGEERIIFLVFPEEVDPDQGKISPASPIGKSLLGKQPGDEISIPSDGQSKAFEVVRLITIHEDAAQ